jgi:superfamily II DNA/RNA helicase
MPEIIVATPDCLCQLLALHALSLGYVSYVVKVLLDWLLSMCDLFCYIFQIKTSMTFNCCRMNDLVVMLHFSSMYLQPANG